MIAMLFFYLVAYSSGAMLLLALLLALDLLTRSRWRWRRRRASTRRMHMRTPSITARQCNTPTASLWMPAMTS